MGIKGNKRVRSEKEKNKKNEIKKKVTKTAKPVEKKGIKNVESEKEKSIKKKTVAKKANPAAKSGSKLKKKAKSKIKKTEVLEMPRQNELDTPQKLHALPDFKYLSKLNYEIAGSYNFHKLALLIIDPFRIYSFWEIDNETLNSLKSRYSELVINKHNLYLKIFDITNINFDGKNQNNDWEINVYDFKGNWFIETNKPGNAFIAKLGFKNSDNSFIEVITSNVIKTPMDRESSNTDQVWMNIDIDKPVLSKVSRENIPYLKYKTKIKPLSSMELISHISSFFCSNNMFNK